MSINITGTPRAILNGVQDRSGSIVSPTLSDIAGFNPVIYLLTQRGPEGTHDLASVGGVDTYGAESFRAGSAYFNHQTVLAREIIPFAPAHIHRVRLPGASRAVLRVSAELATCTIPLYLHDTLGNVITELNEEGVVVPVIDGYTVGSRIILHYGTDIYPEEYRGLGKGIVIEGFRKGDTRASVDIPGLPTSYLSYTLGLYEPQLTMAAADVQPMSGMSTNEILGLDDELPIFDLENINFHDTTLIPLFETEVAYFGKIGDDLGIVIDDLLSAGNVSSVMWDIKNFIYQLRLIERSAVGTKIINTDDGDRVTAFTLGSAAYSDRSHTDYNIKSVIARKYADHLSNTHTYESNLTMLQRMLVEGYVLEDGTAVDGELSYGDDGLLSEGTINVLGGLNATGKPYKTLRLQDSYSFGGATLGGTSPVYGQDGSDGLVYDNNGRPDHLANLRLFDEEVRRQLDNFGDLDDPLLDIARYPISALVDSGFSQETKDAMISAYNKRPDIYALLATFKVADYTEPELPPVPDARKSLMSVNRPPASLLVESTAIKSQYLTYNILKSADSLTTDVEITVKSDIPESELYDSQGNFRPVMISLGINNPDWLYLNSLAPTEPDLLIGTIAHHELVTDVKDNGTFILNEVLVDFDNSLGNQHVSAELLPLNKLGAIRYDGLQELARYQITLTLNYDGLVDPTRAIYKEETSVVNVTVKYVRPFIGDEQVVVLTGYRFEDTTYSGKVSGVSFTDLTPEALVEHLEGYGIVAEFIPLTGEPE